jgi:hypothetical protein
MTSQNEKAGFLTAVTEDGMVILHGSPTILSWVPRDVVTDTYNVGGIVTAGTYDSVDKAKQAALDQYSAPLEAWQASEQLPFDIGLASSETHTPEIDAHKVVRHDIHWK